MSSPLRLQRQFVNPYKNLAQLQQQCRPNLLPSVRSPARCVLPAVKSPVNVFFWYISFAEKERDPVRYHTVQLLPHCPKCPCPSTAKRVPPSMVICRSVSESGSIVTAIRFSGRQSAIFSAHSMANTFSSNG